MAELREQTWAQIGSEARQRYESFGQACSAFGPTEPRLHLNMIGVRQASAGRGIGRRLMDHVHRLAEEDRSLSGVSLTTETESNLSMYRHLGYQVTGESVINRSLRSWGMFRPCRRSGHS